MDGIYTRQEIKLAIDEASQFSMFYNENEHWDALLDLQSRLYEQFGIEDQIIKGAKPNENRIDVRPTGCRNK